MMLLVKTEFKRNFKSLLLWTAIIVGTALMMMAMYPAFKDSFANIEEMLANYPKEFLEAFGLGEGQLNMGDPYGWFGVEGYLFVTLIGGSYAAILGSSILSKEEDDKSIEFLLSKPISRNQILLGKALVVVSNLVVLNIIMGLVLLISFSIIGDLKVLTWLLYIVGPFILEIIFASIAFMVSVFVTKSRKVMSISLGIVIGMYAVDLIAKLTDTFEFLKYITPYEYVNATSIVNDNMIKPLYLLFSLLIVLISGFISWYVYTKKDITV